MEQHVKSPLGFEKINFSNESISWVRTYRPIYRPSIWEWHRFTFSTIRDWSLITGRGGGGGLQNGRGGGGSREVLPLQKGGGGRKKF